MSRATSEQKLLPAWVAAIALRLGPLAVLAGVYYLLHIVLHVPPKILIPALGALALAVFIYFGGRFYRPLYLDREGRCTARNAQQRASCRHFIPGARLGGGCGRLREDGRCRHMQ